MGMEFSRFRKNPNITAAVRLTVDENNVREVGEKVAKVIAEKVQQGGAGGEEGGAKGGSQGGGVKSWLKKNWKPLASTLGSAAISAFSDRFESGEERGARFFSQAAGIGAEKLTGSLLAGQAAQAGVEALTAPGRDVMARARQSTMQRYEDLAAAGFEVSRDDVRRAAAYELERESRREKFRTQAAADFAQVAREKGVTPLSSFGGDQAAQVEQLKSIDSKIGALVSFAQRMGLMPRGGDASYKRSDGG